MCIYVHIHMHTCTHSIVFHNRLALVSWDKKGLPCNCSRPTALPEDDPQISLCPQYLAGTPSSSQLSDPCLSSVQPRPHHLALGPLLLACWWSSVLMITCIGIHIHTHCAHSCLCCCWQQSCMSPGGTQSHCSCSHADLLTYPRAQDRELLTL